MKALAPCTRFWAQPLGEERAQADQPPWFDGAAQERDFKLAKERGIHFTRAEHGMLDDLGKFARIATGQSQVEENAQESGRRWVRAGYSSRIGELDAPAPEFGTDAPGKSPAWRDGAGCSASVFETLAHDGGDDSRLLAMVGGL